MPYCSNCGAELDEDAKFCPSCGTPVGRPVTRLERRRIEREERRPISTLAIVLIVVFASALIMVAVVFSPLAFRPVDVSESRDVPYQAGVDTLNLDFTADVGRVNVAFEELDGKLVTLDVSIRGRVGVFVTDLYDLTFEPTVVGSVLTLTSEVDILDHVTISDLTAIYDLRIDPSVNASLDVKTNTGGIVMDTQAGVVLNSLSLEVTTGGVEANLATGVVVSGDVSIKSTTGGAELNWIRAVVTKDLRVEVRTTTGGVKVDVEQDDLTHDIDLNAETTTGGVDLVIDIQGNVGARLESSTTTGGINVNRQVGFSGTESPLRSENYPASGNFNITLKTTTGGIIIDATYLR